jgi:hypothetical protein
MHNAASFRLQLVQKHSSIGISEADRMFVPRGSKKPFLPIQGAGR